MIRSQNDKNIYCWWEVLLEMEVEGRRPSARARLCSTKRIDRIITKIPHFLDLQHITPGALPFLPFDTVSQLCGVRNSSRSSRWWRFCHFCVEADWWWRRKTKMMGKPESRFTTSQVLEVHGSHQSEWRHQSSTSLSHSHANVYIASSRLWFTSLVEKEQALACLSCASRAESLGYSVFFWLWEPLLCCLLHRPSSSLSLPLAPSNGAAHPFQRVSLTSVTQAH